MAGKRILIVEDESITALDIRQRVQQLGYEPVGIVACGTDAIKYALTLHPDLILMDIALRGPMDGIEAAAVIRSQYPCPVSTSPPTQTSPRSTGPRLLTRRGTSLNPSGSVNFKQSLSWLSGERPIKQQNECNRWVDKKNKANEMLERTYTREQLNEIEQEVGLFVHRFDQIGSQE